MTPAALPNKNLYNEGSEWQNDLADDLPDFYNTLFRNYDAALGRFTAVDPLAGRAESWTGYQYGYNDPLSFNDPLGDVTRKELVDDIEKGLKSSHGAEWTPGGGYRELTADWIAFSIAADYNDFERSW